MRRISLYILIVITAFIANQCANSITAPIGGPKDLIPPEVLESTPENGSPNFIGNKFSIVFNEYIALENIQQAALISPPMKELPDFRVKGKTLQVKFNEELKPNTTYSVYFGDAITDITESNPISNYTYIFSTGEYVDSLSLYGNVLNAFDHTPVEGAFVMLYKDNNDTIDFDSLPYYVPPYYLSKTNVDGKFQFSGLSNEDFLVFSLLDQNSNIVFDQPGETIAFLDSLIHPGYIDIPVLDTMNIDTISEIIIETDSIVAKDSIVMDSTILKQIKKNSIDLFMFLSPDTIQRLLKSEVIAKNMLRFAFSQPIDSVYFNMIKYPIDDSLIIEEYSIERDTLIWHLNNPPSDSLEILITHIDDTLGISYLKLDPKKKSERVRKKDKEEKMYLDWKANIKTTIKPDEQLEIKFNQPMVRFNNLDSSLLVIENDSIWDPEFIFTDSIHSSIRVPFEVTEETNYRVYFPDSSFTSWNNLNTSEININLKSLPISDYGVFIFNLHPKLKQDYVLQMMDENEVIINEAPFNSDTTITYNYIAPAKYKFKIIFDDNSNEKWNPGNYGIRLQPEKVIYFPKEVKIRANWDVEEDWSF